MAGQGAGVSWRTGRRFAKFATLPHIMEYLIGRIRPKRPPGPVSSPTLTGVRMPLRSPLLTGGTLAALLAAPAALPAQRPTTLAGRSTVYAPNGVIATSQPLATAAGLEALRQGGNAVDAAVTAAAVLSVTEPHMTGIGGDMFAIAWLAKERKLVALNASGRAGSLMLRDTLQARGFRPGSQQGAMSVTVPGALAGWEMLVRTHGRRTLAQALQPAIGYARDGFPVSPIIAAQWAGQTDFLERDSAAAATFLPGGRAPKAGEWFRNADYARTLQEIADRGIGTFYGGPLGQRIVARLGALGGFITLADLRRNAPTWVTPISVPFRGYRVWELPPNNQGIAALEMLRILEPYDLKAMGHNSAPYLHHLIEAKKLAYADLDRFVGDAEHLDMPAEAMLTDGFIAERRSHLDPARAQVRVDPGPLRTQSETIYLTAADAEGNMVSLINSNYDYFGSGIVVPGSGFVLHNRGAGFTLTPGRPNTVAPGKRPFHTLIPGFVTRTVAGRERAYMSFGLMGGGMQAQGHVQFLLNYFVFGMDLQAAIDAPRFRHYQGQRVALEAPVGDAVRGALRAMGHEVVDQPPGEFGGAQAIVRLPQGYAAGSDPRKDGMAAGY
jgi:gamma-glutamyltranspeptidase/glutathione hydrolase